MFVKVNPTVFETPIDTSSLKSGNLYSVTLVGDFSASNIVGSEFNPDIFQNSSLSAGGLVTTLGTGSFVDDGSDVSVRMNDTPLNDNSDPDGDYGVNIEKIDFSVEIVGQSGNTIKTIEGEPPASLRFTLSKPLDFDIVIDVQPNTPGWENDAEIPTSFVIKAGSTIVDFPILTALKDGDLESREVGGLTIFAHAEQYDSLINMTGPGAAGAHQLINFDWEITDRSVAGKDAAEELPGKEFIENFISSYETLAKIVVAGDPSLLWAERAVKILKFLGVAINLTVIGYRLESDFNKAQKLPTVDDRAHATYQAIVKAEVDVIDLGLKKSFESLGEFLGKEGASALAGAIVAITKSPLAFALPVLAEKAAGYVFKLTYDKYLSPIVKDWARELVTHITPEADFVIDYKNNEELSIEKGTDGPDQFLIPLTKPQASILDMGDGNDSLITAHLNGVVYGGSGADILKFSSSLLAVANALGATGILDGVRFYGGIGSDTLVGSDNGDLLSGDAGVDKMSGGGGNDIYVVNNVKDLIVENSGGGNDSVMSSVSYSLAANVENLTLTGTGAIDGTGNSRNNVLTGNAAANVLSGLIGSDTMTGGAGDDTYVVDNVGDQVIESAGEGTDTVRSSVSYTLAANVENLVLTGTIAIDGTGNDGDNALTGNAGVNALSGFGGADTLNGGEGADTLTGGAGDDTYVLDNAGDQVVEAAGEGTDAVRSSVSYTLSANVEILVLTGAATIDGTGNDSDNSLTGNDAANALSGLGGADTLDGGAGADTLTGGAGDDTYVVGNVGDLVIEAAGEGTDTVLSSVSYTASANVENLTLTGTGAINGTGNGRND